MITLNLLVLGGKRFFRPGFHSGPENIHRPGFDGLNIARQVQQICEQRIGEIGALGYL
jgi:hypothetical protein